MAGLGLNRRGHLRNACFALAASVVAGLPLFAAGAWASAPVTSDSERAAAVHRTAVLFLTPGVSFERFAQIPAVRGLLPDSGLGLMTTLHGSARSGEEVVLNGSTDPSTVGVPLLVRALQAAGVAVCGPAGTCPPGAAGLAIQRTTKPVPPALGGFLGAAGSTPLLVLVVAPDVSAAMRSVGDEVTPLWMIRPDPIGPSPSGTITSDSTRIPGVVSNVDVAPTILRFFGVPIPPQMEGQPIRMTPDPPPFALHRRHLEYRRTYLPVQLGEVAFISLAGLPIIAALVLMARRGRLDRRFAAAIQFLLTVCVALPLMIMAGGLLPHFTYAWVVPWLVFGTIGLALVAERSKLRPPFGPLRFLALLTVAFVVVDLALFGGNALRFPLEGGTALDGARFYGLPNFATSPLLASGLILAWSLDAFAGTVLLAAFGLMAGFPQLGADVGGAITLFAAAGMWPVLRGHRLELRRLIAAALAGLVAAAAGTLVVLWANHVLAVTPTHATRFAGSSGGSQLSAALHRLRLDGTEVARFPAILIPLVGLAVLAFLLLAEVKPIRPIVTGIPEWRTMLFVLIAAAAVAFVANDTGSTAAAPAFDYAMVGIAYPVMLAARGLLA